MSININRKPLEARELAQRLKSLEAGDQGPSGILTAEDAQRTNGLGDRVDSFISGVNAGQDDLGEPPILTCKDLVKTAGRLESRATDLERQIETLRAGNQKYTGPQDLGAFMFSLAKVGFGMVSAVAIFASVPSIPGPVGAALGLATVFAAGAGLGALEGNAERRGKEKLEGAYQELAEIPNLPLRAGRRYCRKSAKILAVSEGVNMWSDFLESKAQGHFERHFSL